MPEPADARPCARDRRGSGRSRSGPRQPRPCPATLDAMTPAFPSQPGIDVTPQQTEQALADGSAIVVDVREGYEWDAGRIAGAQHVELERLASKSDELARDTTIIFHCRLGARSAMAAEAFRGAGFDAWSMAGGLERWKDEGRPLVPDGATVADH